MSEDRLKPEEWLEKIKSFFRESDPTRHYDNEPLKVLLKDALLAIKKAREQEKEVAFIKWHTETSTLLEVKHMKEIKQIFEEIEENCDVIGCDQEDEGGYSMSQVKSIKAKFLQEAAKK